MTYLRPRVHSYRWFPGAIEVPRSGRSEGWEPPVVHISIWRKVSTLVVNFVVFSLLLGISIQPNAHKMDEANVNAALGQVVLAYSQRAKIAAELDQLMKSDAPKMHDSLSDALVSYKNSTAAPAVSAVEDVGALRRFDSVQYRFGTELSEFLVASDRCRRMRTDARYVALKERLKDVVLAIAVARDHYDDVASSYDAKVQSSRIPMISRMPGDREKPTFADVYRPVLAPNTSLYHPARRKSPRV